MQLRPHAVGRSSTVANIYRLKDSDVTSLYGPLQSGSDSSLGMRSSSRPSSYRISKSNSFNKRPILKNRSISGMVQAVAVPQAHKFRKSGRRCIQPDAGRATFDSVASPFTSRRISRENSSLSSVISSGLPSLGTGEQKHIQFNEQVDQCIALEVVGDKDKELDSSSRKATSQAGLSVDSKTIAILPSTTLKSEEDILEPLETAVKHNLFLGDELEDHNAHRDWQSPNAVANSKDSMIVTQERLQNLHTPGSSSSLNGNSLGIRDTPSDMFMPFEEDNDDVVSNSLFGKVANLVNTAKDIAYVLWNVGRR